MSDFIDELADYLAAQGFGTVATTSNDGNLIVGKLPGSPDACTALFGLPGQVIGDQREVASLNFPRVQAIVRDPDYDLGAARLKDIRGALHSKYGLIFPNWRVMYIHAEQEGGPIGEDDQGRFEFSINFVAEINAETAPAP